MSAGVHKIGTVAATLFLAYTTYFFFPRRKIFIFMEYCNSDKRPKNIVLEADDVSLPSSQRRSDVSCFTS